jgi:hypothetical protein
MNSRTNPSDGTAADVRCAIPLVSVSAQREGVVALAVALAGYS